MTTLPAGWKLAEKLRDSLLWTASSLAALGKEQDVIVLEGRRRTVGEILDEANEALELGTPPASAQGDAKDEKQQFVTWLTGSYPDSYSEPEAVRLWHLDHVSALAWQARAALAAPAAGDARDAIADAFRILRAARASIRAHRLAGPTMLSTDSRALTNVDEDILRAMKALKSSQQQEG